jgi:hypothetical protein
VRHEDKTVTAEGNEGCGQDINRVVDVLPDEAGTDYDGRKKESCAQQPVAGREEEKEESGDMAGEKEVPGQDNTRIKQLDERVLQMNHPHGRIERDKIHRHHTGGDQNCIGLERNEERCRAGAESTKAKYQGSVNEREYNPRNLTWLKRSEKWVMKNDPGTELYPVEKVCIGQEKHTKDQHS